MSLLHCSQQHGFEQEADHGFGGPEHPDQLAVFCGDSRQSLRSGVRLLGQELPCLLLRNWYCRYTDMHTMMRGFFPLAAPMTSVSERIQCAYCC